MRYPTWLVQLANLLLSVGLPPPPAPPIAIASFREIGHRSPGDRAHKRWKRSRGRR